MRSGGASRKIIKRRRILIVLRAIVISSEVEKSFLHNGYRDLCPLPTFSNTSRFPLPKIRRFPACNRDPSASVGMTGTYVYILGLDFVIPSVSRGILILAIAIRSLHFGRDDILN